MTSLDSKPLLERVKYKLRLALGRLLPPGIDYLGLPNNPKSIETNHDGTIKLGAIRKGIENLAQQLGLHTSAKIRALLDIPGHNPFGSKAILDIAEEIEKKIDDLLGT